MKRKMLALVLGLTLAAGTLTACGETANDGTGTGTGTGSGTEMMSPGMDMMSPGMDMMSPEASPSS